MACDIYRRDDAGTWQIYVSIPKEYRHLFGGKRFHRKSSGTKDEAKARRLMLAEAQALELKIATEIGGSEWHQLSVETIPGIISAMGLALIHEFTQARASGDFLRDNLIEKFRENHRDRKYMLELVLTTAGQEGFVWIGLQRDVEKYGKVTLAPWPDLDPLIPAFAEASARQLMPVVDFILDTLDGKVREAPSIAPLADRPLPGKTTYTLTDVYQRWSLEQSNKKTLESRAFMLKTWLKFAGDKPIDAFTREQAGLFKSGLLDGSIRPKGLPVSPRTAENYILGIRALFGYAVDNGMLEKNPFKGLKLPERVAPVLSEVARALDIADLNKLFGPGGPYATIESPRHVLPLLALYTGARLQELAQLEREDFLQLDNRWWIRIHEDLDDDEDGKSRKVKNLYSIRTIPLHQAIVDTGLLDWIQKKAPRTGNVWGLSPNKFGSLGQAVSKQWSKRCNELNVPPRFHRLRHTFVHYCIASNVPPQTRERLIGHVGDIQDRSGYAAATPQLRTPLMEAIDIYKVYDPDKKEGLDLSALTLKFARYSGS